MQSPNAFLDIQNPSRPKAPERPAERTTEKSRGSSEDFREHQARAREKAAEAAKSDRPDRPGTLKPSGDAGPSAKTGKETSPVTGSGDTPAQVKTRLEIPQALKAQVEDLDLPALSQATGLSEGQIQGLLSGELSIEGVMEEGVLPEEMMKGLNLLVEQLQIQAPELASALMGSGLTENVLARLSSGAEPALATQLAGISANGNNGSKNGAGKIELAQVLQASMAAEGETAKSDEPLLRRVLGASATAEPGENQAQSRGNGESQVLQQTANGLRLGDPREPAGTLKHYTTSLETSLNQEEEWHQNMAGKLSWLTTQGLQSAEIMINPPDMGPVEVRIQVQNEQASVSIQAQNASVRDMLEQNSSRLRDMLQEQGLDLSQFDVSDQSSGDQRQSSSFVDQHLNPAGKDQGGVSNGETVTTGEMQLNWSEGIDLYA